mmetsp:Transcript_26289/g.61292  ORF Transcript_26289/g.61292 Transcript_26289/m.61292 type:complete len:225 (-) Transcript_26289:5163-5837(-)
MGIHSCCTWPPACSRHPCRHPCNSECHRGYLPLLCGGRAPQDTRRHRSAPIVGSKHGSQSPCMLHRGTTDLTPPVSARTPVGRRRRHKCPVASSKNQNRQKGHKLSSRIKLHGDRPAGCIQSGRPLDRTVLDRRSKCLGRGLCTRCSHRIAAHRGVAPEEPSKEDIDRCGNRQHLHNTVASLFPCRDVRHTPWLQHSALKPSRQDTPSSHRWPWLHSIAVGSTR